MFPNPRQLWAGVAGVGCAESGSGDLCDSARSVRRRGPRRVHPDNRRAFTGCESCTNQERH